MTARGNGTSQTNIPNSPIAGEDVPVEVGNQELRRARANVEITYRCAPGEFVDIQQAIVDSLAETGRNHMHRDLGDVFAEVDLIEHVALKPEPVR